MLKFNSLPPTPETTDVDPLMIRTLAYGPEHGCINRVAEVAAAVVVANTTDLDAARGIGQKIGDEIAACEAFGAKAQADSTCFIARYNDLVTLWG